MTGSNHKNITYLDKEKPHSTNILTFYSQRETAGAAEERSERGRGRLARCLAPLVGVCE